MKKEIIGLTSGLIRFRSVKSNCDELKRIIDFCDQYLKAEGVVSKRIENDGKHAIILLPEGVNRPRVCLVSHADVVEAEDEQFNPSVRGNHLLGRGAIDMKGGLAISMLLFKKHRDKPVGLIITTDEEVGGFKGAGTIAPDFDAGLFIASEPTDLKIVLKEKGVLQAKLVSSGKSCHGSMPWLGKNAADELIKGYQRVREAFPQIQEDSWKTTMNLGIMSAGTATTIVPDLAEFILDIRYTEEFSPDQIETRIRECIRGLSIELITLAKEPLLINRVTTDDMLAFEFSYSQVLGQDPEFSLGHGASDLRFFSSKGAPCFLFGPIGYNYHGKDEYLEIDSAYKCFQVLDDFLANLS